jgi:hypothetical protein
MISFKPIELKVSVFEEGTEFMMIFKRGEKRNESKKYTANPSKHGGNMQTIEFIGEQEYSGKSGFYREKDGSFQFKEGRIKIVNFLPSAPEVPVKICSVRFDLSQYVGKGRVRDSLTLEGNAFFAEFEILIGPDDGSGSAGDMRGTMATMPVAPPQQNHYQVPV